MLQELSEEIDWELVIQIAVPVLTLVLGMILERIFERRPKLVTFYGHTSVFNVRPPDSNPIVIHSHSVIVRNTGRIAANNVRVGHLFLPPDFIVTPARDHSINQLEGGAAEIVFAKFSPKEQITISYLYYPPVTYHGINTGVRSDEGFARVLMALPTPQLEAWKIRILQGLLIIGVITVLYLAFLLVRQWL